MVETLYVTGSSQWSGSYMQHRITNGQDPIWNINLPMVETVCATRSYQWSGQWSHLDMQHKVANCRDPICNMTLPMVGTLYVT